MVQLQNMFPGVPGRFPQPMLRPTSSPCYCYTSIIGSSHANCSHTHKSSTATPLWKNIYLLANDRRTIWWGCWSPYSLPYLGSLTGHRLDLTTTFKAKICIRLWLCNSIFKQASPGFYKNFLGHGMVTTQETQEILEQCCPSGFWAFIYQVFKIHHFSAWTQGGSPCSLWLKATLNKC